MPLHCSERFDRECEDIADASLGLDDARRARIDLKLAPQSQDLDIDAPIENILMHARGLQQMLPRERALRCFKKGKQQGILTLTQRDRDRIRVDKLSIAAVEYPTVEPVPASLRIARPCSSSHFLPSQNGPDAREQFSETERLYDVVVGAKFEADNTVDFVCAMTGRDNNRNIRVRSHFSQEIQPVIPAKPQIQDYQTWMRSFKVAIQLNSAGCRRGRHIVIFQIPDHHLPERLVVINNNNMAGNRRHQMHSAASRHGVTLRGQKTIAAGARPGFLTHRIGMCAPMPEL